jgi:ferric-dicitrate binding protein FerR (iron transport regulator)
MKSQSADLEGLFNRLADGIASEADEQLLAELLRASPQTRRAYREFMALHSALHWDYVATAAPEPPKQPAPPVSGGDSRMGWLVSFMSGTIVATVVVLAVLQPFSSTTALKPETRAVDEERDDIRDSEGAADQVPGSEDAIAALMVDEVGARFADGLSPDGVQFRPGKYELLEGVMHLRFAQGADVMLASPALLEVQDAQHIRLAYGKIRITAPPTAKGFTVATPAANYVDLGTEFGLRVDRRSGASDLYVFDGQVNVADPQSGKILSEVTGGESSRYVDGVTGAAPQFQENEFPTPGAIGFQRWQQYEQELRQDESLLAFFPFRKAADESVLANGLGEDDMADGRIVGARWTTGRWPGKDALLFDRDTDFAEFNIPGEHEELTIAAWVKVDRLDHVFNAILNSNGYDLGDIHLQLTRQGIPRGGVAVVGKFEETIVGKSVPLGRWTHIVSVLSMQTRSHQIYINGVLARERRWQSDQVLRPGSCRIGNWLAVEDVGPTNRAFRGRMDELAIWRRALSNNEVKQLVEAGRPGMLWNDE